MKGKTKFQSASFQFAERVSTQNLPSAAAVFPSDKTFSTTNEIFSVTEKTLSTAKKILLAVEKVLFAVDKVFSVPAGKLHLSGIKVRQLSNREEMSCPKTPPRFVDFHSRRRLSGRTDRRSTLSCTTWSFALSYSTSTPP